MKLIIRAVFCYVALLPLTIRGDETEERNFQTFLAELNENAARGENGTLINGLFRLVHNGFLGRGGYGLTYRGIMVHSGTDVAMKFTRMCDEYHAVKEYEFYSYLRAIDDPNVEIFGIPAVYYFAHYGGYILMAITLMEPTFTEKCGNRLLTLRDVFITFREFVRITKYIHACGVRHNDIKCDNVMYRKHQAFIIDYNLAEKTRNSTANDAGTKSYLPRSAHSGRIRLPIDDWESFLYSMCHIVGIRLDWFGISDAKRIYELKSNTTNTLLKIQEYRNDKLKRMILKFAGHIFDDNYTTGFPIYDPFYRFFDRHVRRNTQEHILVSWLSPEETATAIQQMSSNPAPDISEIKEPSYMTDDQYPELNFAYFYQKYHSNVAGGAGSSHES